MGAKSTTTSNHPSTLMQCASSIGYIYMSVNPLPYAADFFLNITHSFEAGIANLLTQFPAPNDEK